VRSFGSISMAIRGGGEGKVLRVGGPATAAALGNSALTLPTGGGVKGGGGAPIEGNRSMGRSPAEATPPLAAFFAVLVVDPAVVSALAAGSASPAEATPPLEAAVDSAVVAGSASPAEATPPLEAASTIVSPVTPDPAEATPPLRAWRFINKLSLRLSRSAASIGPIVAAAPAEATPPPRVAAVALALAAAASSAALASACAAAALRAACAGAAFATALSGSKRRMS
jgi:hypothetical protein